MMQHFLVNTQFLEELSGMTLDEIRERRNQFREEFESAPDHLKSQAMKRKIQVIDFFLSFHEKNSES